jgi:type IV pilus assembly protein PilE
VTGLQGHRTERTAASQRGLTLIELMVAVAVIGILSAVAYPSFLSQIRKARRADAIDIASSVQQRQERWRASNPSYAASITALGMSSGLSARGYYTVSSAPGSPASSGYTVTVTANGGTSQASDASCTTMTVTVVAATLSYTPATCWSR